MKRFATIIHGKFDGIYEWGKGFKNKAVMDRWNEFWNTLYKTRKQYIWWRYADGYDFSRCGYLSCNYGSIYMHPMDFKVLLVMDNKCRSISGGRDGKKYYSHFDSVISELKRMCDDCAEYCGGGFSMKATKEFQIEVPDTDNNGLIGIDFDDRSQYAEKFGIEYETE